MPSLDPILPHVLPLMLVVARMTGLFLFTPMISGASVPRQFKVFIAFTLGVAVYPFVPRFHPAANLDLFTLVPLLFSELLIGIVLGLLAALPLFAAQMGGYIMGYQMGLSLAESFNPELESNGSAVGDLVFYLAAFVFIGVGGLELLFTTLAESFRTAPVGAFGAGDVPLDTFVAVLSGGLELAVRVSTPVMAIVGMLMISMGLIMKTMPQLNIMSVGFAAQIVAGIIMLALALPVIGMVTGDEVRHALELVTAWVHALGPTGGAHG